MAPSPSTELTAPQRAWLLALARQAISTGCEGREAPELAPETLPAPLRAPRAVFVTLSLDGRLRGCIGSLEAREPLANAVVEAARGAAFRDPRFTAVSTAELALLRIKQKISCAIQKGHCRHRAGKNSLPHCAPGSTD